MKLLLVTLMLSLSSFNASALETAKDINHRIGGHTCGEQVKKLITKWGAIGSWQMSPSFVNPGKEFTFKSPSLNIGEWVQIQFKTDRTIILEKLTATTIISKSYADKGNSCDSKIVLKSFEYNDKYMKNAFTDFQLKESLKRNKKGVIYIWSPNMPLSVTGLDYLLKHAKKMGIHVTAIVDPFTHKKAVSSLIETGKVSKKNAKRLESYELIQRGAMTHYPAFFTYKDGFLSRGPKFGYEDDKQTLNFLKERF